MKTQTIKVKLCDINKIAEILCEIDSEQAENNSREMIKMLIENAHETVSNMLGKQAPEFYQKDDKE